MSTTRLFTSTGKELSLGLTLGKGGEGTVHQINGDPRHVAKVYHTIPDGGRQEKLRVMASLGDADIQKFVAWPVETLHVQRGGPVRGFVMPIAGAYVPVHQLYNPGHRKQEQPQLSWKHLLVTARNTADAFAAVHQRGLVVGDVNENSVMVAPSNGHVMLIDADSFQVNAHGRVFPCLVGVPDFTPPELHAVGDFNRMIRTANHDSFGLAILIFQLLLGGRHPFAGRPLRNDVGNDMSVDISQFRFADALDNDRRGLVPPPIAVPVTILPDVIHGMFTQAFTEPGIQRRPTAREWVSALDRLRPQTAVCHVNAHHAYLAHVGACPWCSLDSSGIVHFVRAQVAAKVQAARVTIGTLWAQISAVPPPEEIAAPPGTGIKPVARPLPPTVHSKATPFFVWPVVVGLVFASIVVAGAPGLLALVLPVLASRWLKHRSEPRNQERNVRLLARKQARDAHAAAVREAEEAGPAGFQNLYDSLSRIYSEYTVEISRSEGQTLAEFDRTVRDRQLRRHLERQYVSSASIRGIGPNLKQRLVAYGVNTAADVNQARVMEIPGFGDVKTGSLVAWRDSCERTFRYNPQDPAIPKEREQALAVYERRRRSIENDLQRGLAELQRRSRLGPEARADLEQKLAASVWRLTQADADLAAL
ncbi:protein kinase YegI [Frankia sp. Hr75.2]|nr:protein kinase YegI [Frankia sp. Hr75.2]